MSDTLAQWLQARMAERNLGRNELSRLSGVSLGSISRILRIGHIPGPDILVQLADYFGVKRDIVLEAAGLIEPSSVPEELPPALQQLVFRLSRLSEPDLQAVLQNFDSILKLAERRHRDRV